MSEPLAPPAPTPEDVAQIRATVDRALRPLALPARPEMADLEQRLREYVELLLPAAEAVMSALRRGSVDWCRHHEHLDRIRRHAGQGLGGTPLSAHVQLRHLARDCAALLEYVECER
ncbi:hypothetical protein DVA86_13290 [Streptomyces armeniacus]|uniref:Uncharacterized protein n=1 Tax=Streptomyces armeniacus TaxID=83291 RepID=A0A345XPB4_9ACTN|nr:DUF6415 family natural product biosynthesis protein [Streptomyces armeniacus]AXK33480.1 hypothetical protein DVA86_13290 [Streptomyces armeniacus]